MFFCLSTFYQEASFLHTFPQNIIHHLNLTQIKKYVIILPVFKGGIISESPSAKLKKQLNNKKEYT